MNSQHESQGTGKYRKYEQILGFFAICFDENETVTTAGQREYVVFRKFSSFERKIAISIVVRVVTVVCTWILPSSK